MSDFVVDFPTIGDLIDAWITRHCVNANGFQRGKPFELADWQFWCMANHYRVRSDAVFVHPDDATPENPVLLNQAFTYRRSMIIAPQKTGKGPWSAAMAAVEAAGPSLFAGWAVEGDEYLCSENGCPCGWLYQYLPGEPKGMRHPSPLGQITAVAEDQVRNIYGPLQAMIKLGPLKHLMKVREGFIRVLGASEDEEFDRIDVVTSSAKTRLGNPISFAIQDEVGIWNTDGLIEVADAQNRGLAGMQGRSIATTNAFDPAENSYAQIMYEEAAEDVFIFFRQPPSDLDFKSKSDRLKILEYVYEGSWWVNLKSINAEAESLLKRDPAQAERFFGNRLVQGSGAYIQPELWDSNRSLTVSSDMRVCLGFDGSTSGDWTAIRAETADGYRFTPTYGPDNRKTIWNPAEWGGRIPRSEVEAAVDELFRKYKVKRFYCDTREWVTEVDQWAITHGEKVVVAFPTYSIMRMHKELDRYLIDLETNSSRHDGCSITQVHALNAIKVAKPGDRYILAKASEHQKIDVLMTDILAHAAAADAHVAKEFEESSSYAYFV